MSTEDEFGRWLRRPEKSFQENLQFAMRAWQSVEFTFQNKCEVVLSWLTDEVKRCCVEKNLLSSFPEAEFLELFQLRCQPGLVAHGVKRNFIEAMINLSATWENEQVATARTHSEVLQRLCQFELLQDVYRSDHELLTRANGALLRQYEKFLRSLSLVDGSSSDTTNRLLPEQELQFIEAIISSLKDNAKRATEIDQFDSQFKTNALQPLIQVFLILRSHSLCIFESVLSLEKMLTEQYTGEQLLERISTLPLHARLVALECSIINRRGLEDFFQLLLSFAFDKQLEIEANDDPELALITAAYTLEMLRMHDINMHVKTKNDKTALVYLEQRLVPLVERFKDSHLREVLMLLGAALRLNPLILEHHVFQVTTLLMMAPKSCQAEQQLYEQFLVLLMDMFRRLSRAEKFVGNLLKALNDWCKNNDLSVALLKKRKRKTMEAEGSPLKKRKTSESSATIMTANDSQSFYLSLLFSEFQKSSVPELTDKARACYAANSFSQLDSIWPSASAGMAFSKLITGLVSKPSLVIWKTLLYSLKELLKANSTQVELDETLLFQIDFHAALLCQFFAGSKLAEQTDKFHADIEAKRSLTSETMATFGHFVLAREHQKRIMNAFLESCYYAGNFDLLFAYYRPDGCTAFEPSAVGEHLHGFLTEEEWSLIKQRVLNFGKSNCKFLLNRLLLQRKQAKLLLLQGDTGSHELSLKKSLLSPPSLSAELEELLQAPNAKWLVAHLKRKEKMEIAKTVLERHDLLFMFIHDLESVELLALSAYEQLSTTLAGCSPTALLAALECDFIALRRRGDPRDVEDQSRRIIEIVATRVQDQVDVLKDLPVEEIETSLNVLHKLPLGFLRLPMKNLILVLHLALYGDLKASGAEDLAVKAFDVLTDFLHFGQHVAIFEFFSASLILKLMPIATCWEFYEYIFSLVKSEEKGSANFLTELSELIRSSQEAGKLSADHRRVLLLAIESMSTMNRAALKSVRSQYDLLMEIYAEHVHSHFSVAHVEQPKKDKKFVEKTLSGFAAYTKWLLARSEAKETPKRVVDEQFRRVCKIFIGHSVDYRNPSAIQLVQVALNNRKQLHLDQDEIEVVLRQFWRQLNADLKLHQLKFDKNTETVLKAIIAHKTNEDFLLTMKDIGANSSRAVDPKNITDLLTLIAKCTFSNIKGAIFNEHFKQITCDIILHLAKSESQQFVDTERVVDVLNCQRAIVDNRMVPISYDTLDSILGFLMNINIKKLKVSDTNADTFHCLHRAMSDVGLALIKHRHVMLMDRIPQFMHIFKDLVQAIVWYKSDRHNDAALSTDELNDIGDSALKLEALMHLIASHSVDVRRIAPFVLTFVINLMVANKRSTTLYPKIKKHIESICCDLITVCDHRMSRFILRSSNEAARQVYEMLMKDHKKYHKFKGKV